MKLGQILKVLDTLNMCNLIFDDETKTALWALKKYIEGQIAVNGEC